MPWQTSLEKLLVKSGGEAATTDCEPKSVGETVNGRRRVIWLVVLAGAFLLLLLITSWMLRFFGRGAS